MSLTLFCPRCGGAMFPAADLQGEYDWCLTCGYHRDMLLGPPVELPQPEPVKGAVKMRPRREPRHGAYPL